MVILVKLLSFQFNTNWFLYDFLFLFVRPFFRAFLGLQQNRGDVTEIFHIFCATSHPTGTGSPLSTSHPRLVHLLQWCLRWHTTIVLDPQFIVQSWSYTFCEFRQRCNNNVSTIIVSYRVLLMPSKPFVLCLIILPHPHPCNPWHQLISFTNFYFILVSGIWYTG